MKTPNHLLLWLLLLTTFSATAQVQWYQNQDGQNPPPGGTFSSCAQKLTPYSFIACYQWSSNGPEYTWKISKSHINGTEQRSFFLTGTWASVEMKAGRYNAVYVLLRSFPADTDAVFKVYKLDSNLVVRAVRQLSFPNGFSIFNVNAFEADRLDNIYLAGDGQYPSGDSYAQASFIIKTDKHLSVRWTKIDSLATSYTGIRVEPGGRVAVLEDQPSSFPDLKVRKYTSTGFYLGSRTYTTDPGRFNALMQMDDDGNIFLYGGKSVGDTAQALYLFKVARNSGNIVFAKTHFTAPGIQLHQLAMDNDGRLFTLLTQYQFSGEQQTLVSRIHQVNGSVLWSRNYNYAADSNLLSRLVITEDDRFFVLGERRNADYLSKGVVIRLKKNGQQDGGYNGPDSIAWHRSHALIDGFADRNGQLVIVGNTNDFDPQTYSSTYFRAFALRFGNGQHHGCDDKSILAKGTAEEEVLTMAAETGEEPLEPMKLVVYPNPVQDELFVSNIDRGEFDQLGIYSMQGAQLQKQAVNNKNIRIDISSLSNGVYLLILRSSATMKEKSVKFVVSR